MRTIALFAALTIVGCASRHKPEADPPACGRVDPPARELRLEDYSTPFGHAPYKADLEEVFLSLPDELVGDMPVNDRKEFINEVSSDSVNHMFDRQNKYLTWFTDGPDGVRASCIFELKILPSSKYRYVVVVHLKKAWKDKMGREMGPSPANTFFLASNNSRWIDITNEVLPKEICRDWFFHPLWSDNVIETGPYQRNPDGNWNTGETKFDLVWKTDHFKVRPHRQHASSNKAG